jgi:hypothetical protein
MMSGAPGLKWQESLWNAGSHGRNAQDLSLNAPDTLLVSI